MLWKSRVWEAQNCIKSRSMLNQITVRSTFNWVESRYRLTEITVIIRVSLSPITVVSWIWVLWKAYFRHSLLSFSAGIPFPGAAHCSFHQVLRPLGRLLPRRHLWAATANHSLERQWTVDRRIADAVSTHRKQDFQKYSKRGMRSQKISKSAKTEILIHVTVSKTKPVDTEIKKYELYHTNIDN